MKIEIKHLTLARFINMSANGGVDDILEFLCSSAPPERIRIGIKTYSVPQTADELREALTYGQKVFLSEQPKGDLDLLLRMFAGWYYPILTKNPFDADKAFNVAGKSFRCFITELIPACAHIAKLVSELNEFEEQVLASDPDSLWMQAGGSNLSKYAPMLTVEYLAGKLKCTNDDVFDKPYSECLFWLMYQNESNAVEKRFNQLNIEKAKHGSRNT